MDVPLFVYTRWYIVELGSGYGECLTIQGKWGRTTVNARQLGIYGKNSPVFLAYSDVFDTKKGGLRKSQFLDLYQYAWRLG
jgi:hypothetical protein